jgi:hypothetical protein
MKTGDLERRRDGEKEELNMIFEILKKILLKI